MELRNEIHQALDSDNLELAIELWGKQALLCEARGEISNAAVCRANADHERKIIARRKATRPANFAEYRRLVHEGVHCTEALIASRGR